MPLALRNLLLILPLLVSLQAGLPAAGVNIQEDRARPDFPNSITFSLRADDPDGIAKVTLIYGTDAQLCLAGDTRHDFDIQNLNLVDVSWTWDLSRSANLPPGVNVHWRWEIVDSSGATQLTDVKSLEISDPNFTWQKLNGGSLKVAYADGGSDFGQMVLDDAASSLQRIGAQTGVDAPTRIQIVVYPSAEDLRKATLNMPDWIGGVAFPEFDVVLIAIPTSETDWAAQVIPHELTHLIVHRRIANCQGAMLPTWLDEGLAVSSEGPASSTDTEKVMQALKTESAPDLIRLSDGFSGDAALADEEYAQSGLVTRWLLQKYGPGKMDELLGSVQSGNLIDAALQQVYGQDTDGLDQAWRVSLGFAAHPTQPAGEATLAPTAVPTLALQSPLVGLASATPTSRPTLSATASAEPAVTLQPMPTGVVSLVSPSAAPRIPEIFFIGGAAVLLVALGAILTIRPNSRE